MKLAKDVTESRSSSAPVTSVGLVAFLRANETIEDGMSNAEWEQLRADDEGAEEEKPEPSPSTHEPDREGTLPGALVPPPFDDDEEPPFTD